MDDERLVRPPTPEGPLVMELHVSKPLVMEPSGRFDHPSPDAVHRLEREAFSIDAGCDRCAERAPLTAAEVEAARISQNVLIFDWDDTLLPSTFVVRHRGCPGGLTAEARADLALTGLSVARLLERACVVGAVSIITNADEGWVESSAAKYMPAVVPLLRSGAVRVFSARRAFEQRWPALPHLWKEAAFQQHLAASFEAQTRRYGAAHACRNVVSLGDSTDERYALWNALQKGSAAFGKSVKFVPHCLPAQLRQQHAYLLKCFDSLLQYDGHLDLMLTTDDGAAAVAEEGADEQLVGAGSGAAA